MTAVGIVGLGLLGSAVAARLLAAGESVVGHDVAPERGAALARLGGSVAPSLEAVVAAADVLCTVLPTPAAVEEVLLGPRGVAAVGRAGQTIVQMSTISPALTERLASTLQARGLVFLDCPVSGTSGMVAAGNGLFLVGGDPAAIARWRPLLESTLPRVVAVGRAGQASFLKLVANLLVGVHSAAAAEALELARRGGLDLALVLEVLTASAAGSRMLEVRGPLVARREFPPQMKLDLFLKDLRLIREAADAAGARVPLTDAATRLYSAARDAGHGGEDLAAVARVIAAGPEAAPGPSAADEAWMRQALAEGRDGRAKGNLGVGAVIVREGRIVARGHNEVVSGCDPSAHAELVALRRAAAALGTPVLTGCAVYTTLEPCLMCAAALATARVDRVVVGAFVPRTGGVRSLARVLDLLAPIHRRVEAVGEVFPEECLALLPPDYPTGR